MKKILPFAFFVSIIWNGYAQTGNIGIGNNTPVTKLDIAGDLALREGTAIAVAGANPVVPVVLTAAAPENSFYRITGAPTGTMTLNSIANGQDGQIIILVNATSINLSITNNNAASGILTPGATAQIIPANGSITLQYSTQVSRWFAINSSGSVLPDWTKVTTASTPAVKTDAQYVTGNVGVGDFSVNSPYASLDVIGNIYTTKHSNINMHDATEQGTTYIGMKSGNTGDGFTGMKMYVGAYGSGGINNGSRIGFQTWGNTISTTREVATINEYGNVGINMTSPQYKLDVNGTGLFRNGNTGSAYTNNQLLFGYAGTNTYMHALKSRHNSGALAGNALDFFVWKQGTDAATTIGTQHVMTLDGNGNVGIGNTAPTNQLEITGSTGSLELGAKGWLDPGAGSAGICADNTGFKTLMVVGNNAAGNLGQNREVQVWDYLKVNGYLTVGTQANATATAPPAGTMRYNSTRQCMEYWNGTYWICMGPPTVQKVTVRDIIDGGYTGTGCNTCTSWAGSYGGTYPFTINNLYAGQKIMFYVEIFLDNDTHKNGAYANAMKIYGGGVFMEDESMSPGYEQGYTKVFPAQTVTSTGNIGFTFESNQGFTDLRITAVAY